MGIEDAVIKGVSFFLELVSKGFPEFAPMDNFGIGNVLEDKIIRLESVYSVDTHFSSCASSFLVQEALLSP